MREQAAVEGALLDDDDEWLPAKLLKQVRVMAEAPPEVGLVYCWMDHFDGAGRLVGETHPTLRGNVFGQVLDRPRMAELGMGGARDDGDLVAEG